MNTYQELKKELLEALEDLDSLLSVGKGGPGMTDRLFEEWEATCGSIRRQLSDEMIRVAVVGSIKSGKSTFVNALIQGDHLKRGAGVVTSIVTKIRQGKSLRARMSRPVVMAWVTCVSALPVSTGPRSSRGIPRATGGALDGTGTTTSSCSVGNAPKPGG